MIHTAETSDGFLERLLPVGVYARDDGADEMSTAPGAIVFAFTHFPHPRDLQNQLAIRAFTPIVALCLPAPELFLKEVQRRFLARGYVVRDERISKFSVQEKSALASAIGESLFDGMIVAIAVPQSLIVPTQQSIGVSYRAFVNYLVFPLLSVHARKGVSAFHVRIGSLQGAAVDVLRTAKAATKALFPRDGSAGLATDYPTEPWSESLLSVARFVAWCIGRHYNNDDSEYLQLLGDKQLENAKGGTVGSAPRN